MIWDRKDATLIVAEELLSYGEDVLTFDAERM
jgi:hypothetical protein